MEQVGEERIANQYKKKKKTWNRKDEMDTGLKGRHVLWKIVGEDAEWSGDELIERPEHLKTSNFL